MEIDNKTNRLCRQLQRRIANMADGEEFPSVRQLISEYKLSQVTVTAAVNQLKEKGCLESFVGRGTFVRRKAVPAHPKMVLLQPDWPSSSLARTARLLEYYALKHGFQFEPVHRDYRDDLCMYVNDYEADVIVLDSVANDQLNPEQLMSLSRSAAPVIISNNTIPVAEIRYVCGDNVKAGGLAARYLVEMGHRKLGFLFSEPHIISTDSRLRNFEMVASACGCDLEILDCRIVSGERSDRKIREFMKQFAAGKYDFSALFVISDISAVKAAHYLEEFGVRVPEDLSILGFGDEPEPGMERLSTVGVDHHLIAESVIGMAENILHHRLSFKTQIDVEPKVVDRGSVIKYIPKNEKKYA